MSETEPSQTSEASPSRKPLLSVRGLVKRFGSFVANDHVDLDLFGGEVHALVGENGAGKSTFVKMLYGVLEPTEGTLLWEGRYVTLPNPEAARALGVGMVFQHFSLFENLTVADNIALVLPKGEMRSVGARIEEVARRYGIVLDPGRPVWTLSAGERQRIEIARCLLQDPKLLILDEPTSVLTPQEAELLFVTLDRLKSEGRALLYISHRLDEVRRLCDRATILRHGKVVGTCDPRQETARSIAALMVGAQISEVSALRRSSPEAAVRFATHNLSAPAPDLHGTTLDRINLSARAGEILGIAGVAGNGQSELFELLSGERAAQSADAVQIDGLPVGLDGVTARRRLKAAFVPEERNGHAAAPVFSLSDNVVLTRHATGGVVSGGLILDRAAKALASTIGKVFDVRKSGVDPAARTLSGGNLQKFVVGREILRDPAVLIISQPTWGVDAAAGATIRQAIVDLAAKGAAVVVISQDLDELFEICDRIAVIHAGHLSTARPARDTTREEIGLLMGGAETGTAPEGSAHAH